MLPAILLLLPACGGDPPAPEPAGWLVETIDLGPALASGEGYVFGNGSDAWFAAAQVVPELEWDAPAIDVPLYLWESVQADNIADEGSCPYKSAAGSTTTWRSDCRSQDGYDWEGDVVLSWGEFDGGRAWSRWEFDLHILGDVEGASFDRLDLEGSVRIVAGDGEEALVRAIQVNARAGVDGYWERHDVSDEREVAWADWVLTGRAEEVGDGVHHVEGRADLGAMGGFRFWTDSLAREEDCAGEPVGELVLEAEQQARLTFEGLESCDRCADYVLDGEFAGRACAR